MAHVVINILRRNIMIQSGNCPICEADVESPEVVEEAEVMNCPDCQSMLVVDSFQSQRIVLVQAPQIEEDWGE